jgi:protein arginine N-methyltransferase 1
MLADRVRVDTYHAAIARHIGPRDVVIDLGTGSGVLAFLASRHAAQVYAIDHSTMTALAAIVMAANGINNVELLKVNSRKLTLPDKVDVILHEQMGHALFDERMVLNVCDLRDRLLKPGGRIIPAVFDVFLDPVQIKDEYLVPFAWEQRIHGLSFAALRQLEGSMAPDYLFKELPQWEYHQFLCDSEPMLSFDLMTVTEDQLPHRFQVTRPVTTAGRLDGICLHFTAHFDDELKISTSPFAPATHWRVPLLRTESHVYGSGELLTMTVDAPDLTNLRTWTWSAALAA